MTDATDPPPVAQRRRRFGILMVFIGVILSLIFAFRAVLTPFLVALFVAYLLHPLVERMAPFRIFGRFPLGRGGSIVIIYVVLIGAITMGVIFSLPALGRQLDQARKDLPKVQQAFEVGFSELVTRISDWWENKKDEGEQDENGNQENGNGEDPPPIEQKSIGPPRSRFHLKGGGSIEGVIVSRSETQVVLELGTDFEILDLGRVEREEKLIADDTVDPRQYSKILIKELVGRLGDILRITVGVVTTVLGTIMKIFLILMVTAFLLIDVHAIVQFIESVPPKRYRPIWSELIVYMDRGLAGVIRGQLMICLVNGLLTWVGLEFLGVRYAGLLGFIAGVFSLIPIFGTILSTIPIVLIAWGADSFGKGLLALCWILLIHFLEANFLNPKIMGTASKIHPVVVIFALIAGEHAYGIVGALLAVPTASIVQSWFKFYVIDKRHEGLVAEDSLVGADD